MAQEFEIRAEGPFDFARSARFLETWPSATGTNTGTEVAFGVLQ